MRNGMIIIDGACAAAECSSPASPKKKPSPQSRGTGLIALCQRSRRKSRGGSASASWPHTPTPSSQLYHRTFVLMLHVLRDCQKDLLAQRVQQPFLHKSTVRHQTHFPHWHRGFEVPHHLQLLRAQVLERECRENGYTIFGLDHLLERFDAAGFVVEIVILLHLRLQFTQMHDLGAHAVSLLQEPQVPDVDVVRQHVALPVHLFGRRGIHNELLIKQRLLENPRIVERRDQYPGVQQVLFQAVNHGLGVQLGDFQPYTRIFLQEAVEKQRQEVRCDGGEDAQPEVPDHFPLALAHQLTESLYLLQNHACLLDNLYPIGGRYHRH